MDKLKLSFIDLRGDYIGKWLFLLPSKILVLIENGDTITSISKKTFISTNSIFRNCDILIKAKLIIKKKIEGKRIRPIELTNKGETIQKLMREVMQFNNEKIQLSADL